MATGDGLTHASRHLTDPDGWVLYLSHTPPKRLVVFVHGFWGGATKTWRAFPDSGRHRAWWKDCDMLFVGYPSGKENLVATAFRLRQHLPRFYPNLPASLVEAQGVQLRDSSSTTYTELYLVGHSLGGVVIRRALCDLAMQWLEDEKKGFDRPALLDACVRLFSPASAGFSPAGFVGQAKATPLLWAVARMKLQGSSAFNDLREGSQILQETRTRTEALVDKLQEGAESALRAYILWANPDNIVVTEHYSTDHSPMSVDQTSHSSVCKPGQQYQTPWIFVENGSV